MRSAGADGLRAVAMKHLAMRAERRDPTLLPKEIGQPERREEPVSEAKPYDIPKQLVWEAYQRVKANRGAAGVDGVSLATFEKDLKGNLYKVWNRIVVGLRNHPPPVRLVEIPKATTAARARSAFRPLPTAWRRRSSRWYFEPLRWSRGSIRDFLRLSARSFCARRSRDGAETVLGDRLGRRSGHQGVLGVCFILPSGLLNAVKEGGLARYHFDP